jgi:hypothetical protein
VWLCVKVKYCFMVVEPQRRIKNNQVYINFYINVLYMFYVCTLVFYDMFVIMVYFVFVTWGSKN